MHMKEKLLLSHETFFFFLANLLYLIDISRPVMKTVILYCSIYSKMMNVCMLLIFSMHVEVDDTDSRHRHLSSLGHSSLGMD